MPMICLDELELWEAKDRAFRPDFSCGGSANTEGTEAWKLARRGRAA